MIFSILLGTVGVSVCRVCGAVEVPRFAFLVERRAGRGSQLALVARVSERAPGIARSKLNHHFLGEEVGGLSTRLVNSSQFSVLGLGVSNGRDNWET